MSFQIVDAVLCYCGSFQIVVQSFTIFMLFDLFVSSCLTCSVCQGVSNCCRLFSLSYILLGCLHWFVLFWLLLGRFKWWDSSGFGCLSLFEPVLVVISCV